MWNKFLIWLGIRSEPVLVLDEVVSHVTRGDVREDIERKPKQMKSRSRK